MESTIRTRSAATAAVLNPVLANLSFNAGGGNAPTLKYYLGPEADDFPIKRNALVDPNAHTRLVALSTALGHLRRLKAFPTLEFAFWKAILECEAVNGVHDEDCFDVRNWLWLITEDAMPSVSIERRLSGMTRPFMEALFLFFTAPPEHQLEDSFACDTETDSPMPSLWT